MKKLNIDGDFGRNWKSKERSRQLFKNISASTSIENLFLANLGSMAVMFLPSCFNNVYCLELWHCRLGGNVHNVLNKLIKASDCKLEKVVFVEGYTSPFIDFGAGYSLLEALKSNTSVKALKFQLNDMLDSDSGREIYSVLLHDNTSLTELDISNNSRINDENITTLMNALSSNTTIKTLRLENLSHVTRNGWRSIATIYIRSRTCALENLYLGGNTLDNGTFREFGSACYPNRTLKKLCLKLPSNRGLNTPRVGWTPWMSSLMRIVYNKNNIMETFNSNHVLETICYPEEEARFLSAMSTCPLMGKDLPSALQMNREPDKFTVARRKILQSHYYNQDDIKENKEGYRGYKTLMDTILEITDDMEREKQLPHIMSWTGRDNDGLPLMYELLQRSPTLCESIGRAHVDTSAKRQLRSSKRKR